MKKIIRLTESDLTRIVKRVIRENEEQTIESEEIKQDVADATRELSREEKEFLKNYIEKNGMKNLQNKIVDHLENKENSTELDENEEMGETEYKLRKILDKVITYGGVAAGLAVLPAAMFIGGGVAAGLGIASLAGVALKDAAWWKSGGKYSDHHYGPSDKSRKDWNY
jgi:hypothetical protein